MKKFRVTYNVSCYDTEWTKVGVLQYVVKDTHPYLYDDLKGEELKEHLDSELETYSYIESQLGYEVSAVSYDAGEFSHTISKSKIVNQLNQLNK